MALFYDWRDRTGKEGLKPFREQLKELRSPLFIGLGIVLLVIVQHIADFPDQTLKERAVHFGVSTFCIGYSLKRLGYTRKKRRSVIRSGVMKNDRRIVNNSNKSKSLVNL